MRHLRYHIYIAVVTAICCLHLQSCSNGKELEPDADNGLPENVMIGFRIVVPSAAATRGGAPDLDGKNDWSDFEGEDGNEFECKIESDKLYVALYDADDGSPIGKVDYMLSFSKADNSSPRYYEVMGKLSFADADLTLGQLKAKNVKVMVFANVRLAKEIFGGDLSSESGGVGAECFSSYGKASDLSSIPMWGVVTTKFDLTGSKFDIPEEIKMLRSMAKVEVSASTELEGLAVEAVKVSKINEKGYFLPGTWNKCSKTEVIKFAETLRVPEQTPVSDKTFAAESNAVSIYLPECKNESLDDITLTVTYSVDGGEKKEGTIKLCRYDESGIPATGAAPWDIVRNHIYRYEITGVTEEKGLKFRVTIEDMTIAGIWEYEYEEVDNGRTDIDINPWLNGGETELE